MLRLDPGGGEDEAMGIKEEDDDEDEDDEQEEDYLVMAGDEQAEEQQQRRRGGRAREEKERTKLRERRRRAITGRILAGLRRHGNYSLRVRADINEVVAALARDAGWVVLPDGTTFPSSSHSQVTQALPAALPFRLTFLSLSVRQCPRSGVTEQRSLFISVYCL